MNVRIGAVPEGLGESEQTLEALKFNVIFYLTNVSYLINLLE